MPNRANRDSQLNNRLLDHLPTVADRIAAAPHVLLGLDYDGTLTHLVGHPSQAWLESSTRDLIRQLAGRAGWTVAIISGRSLNDLQVRVGLPKLIYAGNHGLEICSPEQQFVEPQARARRDALTVLSQHLKQRLKPIAGAFLEEKGLTTSIHYRQVAGRDVERLWQIVEQLVEERGEGFCLTPGNKVLEIRPAVEWNKGMAVTWIKDQIGYPETLVIYCGDDATDEDVFRSLPRDITVKVGTPGDSLGIYHVADSQEIRDFLQWLSAR